MFVPEEELGGMEGMRLFVHTDHFKELNLGFALDEGIGDGFYIWQLFVIIGDGYPYLIIGFGI